MSHNRFRENVCTECRCACDCTSQDIKSCDKYINSIMKIYHNDNTVVAVCSFNGKRVKATAKCNPEDTFDFDKGKRIAIARCNAKIAKLRLKSAQSHYVNIKEEEWKLKNTADKIAKTVLDAQELLNKCNKTLKELEKTF